MYNHAIVEYMIEVYIMRNIARIHLALFFGLIFVLTSGFTVVGHRGDPTKYPEETIQSDDSAFRSGADYVELDLHLSKDGVLVVSHDDDLFRVTHIHAIVSQNNFSALHRLQYDNGEHVLSLSQLFKHYQKDPQAKFVLETKIDHHQDPSYQLEEKIAQVVKKYHMEKRIMIHSFSAASLFKLHELLPRVYLIFLVGSLKRINFSILPQVNAINASSDIVQNHPFLIHWLHKLHKQLYVWAEMDESPALWHWLINRNIDGVVTNFPATGFKYKLAKSGSKKYLLNRSGIYFGKKKTPIFMNPYVKVKRKKFIYPYERLQITYAVRKGFQLYYQIAEKSFISAEFVNLDLTLKDIAPYQDKKIIAKSAKVPIYRLPENQAKTNKTLTMNQLYKILNFNGTPKSLWLDTKVGWIKAKDILFYGFFTKNSFKQYHSLNRISRYHNLALLPYRLPQVKTNSYWQNIKFIQKLH